MIRSSRPFSTKSNTRSISSAIPVVVVVAEALVLAVLSLVVLAPVVSVPKPQATNNT
jgi:hypothetical protein